VRRYIPEAKGAAVNTTVKRTTHPQTEAICVIVGAGTNDVVPPPAHPSDYLIAADGGLDFLSQHHRVPRAVIGDFDSARAGSLASLKGDTSIETVQLPTEKDDTDMTSAVKLGWSKGYRLFSIYGGLGGRLDHTLANIQLLNGIALHGGVGFLHSAQTCVTALSQARIDFAADPTSALEMVSVFAASDAADDVSIEGLKYEVSGVRLHNSVPLGVSNEFTGSAASISVGSGVLTVTFPEAIAAESVALRLPAASSFGEITTKVSDLLATKDEKNDR
jgi:thiamine pyrophosphokinase